MWPPDDLTTREQACGTVVEMHGLRNLRVSLSDCRCVPLGIDDESVAASLRPLMAVKVLEFVVEFYWPVRVDAVLKRLGKVTFSISLK